MAELQKEVKLSLVNCGGRRLRFVHLLDHGGGKLGGSRLAADIFGQFLGMPVYLL